MENAGQLRSTQVVVLALVLGQVALAVVAGVLVTARGPLAQTPGPLLLGALAAVTCGAVGAALVLPARIAAAQRTAAGSARDADRVYSTTTILRAAVLEGAGLFGAVVLLLTGMWPALLATAVSIGMVLVQSPSAGRREDFRRMQRPG
jgi:hypothetical protein